MRGEDRLGFPHSQLGYLSRPPGYKKLLHGFGRLRKGVNLLDRSWDVCVVLDACRADLFRSVLGTDWDPPQPARWGTVRSLDSATAPWIKKTFLTRSSGEVEPITYVSANPHSVDVRRSTTMYALDEVWRYGWDDGLGTVPPGVVTDRGIHHYRRRDERVMLHYVQPHVPFLTRRDGALTRRFGSATPRAATRTTGEGTSVGSSADRPAGLLGALPGAWDHRPDRTDDLFERLRRGDIDRPTAWSAYRETLQIVLEEVTILLRSVDADEVVITADHGNAFGEWGLFGHPRSMPFSVLREVPYVTTRASAEREYVPRNYDLDPSAGRLGNPDAFEEKLDALGYVA